ALFEEGRLPTEIEERASEHILDCARCRDQYLLWCSLNVRTDELTSDTSPLGAGQTVRSRKGLDFLIATLILLACLPVFIEIALLLEFEDWRQPLFVRHPRIDHNGKQIYLYR